MIAIDPESLRLVLDGAYERLQALQLRADDPRRVAFEEVAEAVGWVWYPADSDGHVGLISL